MARTIQERWPPTWIDKLDHLTISPVKKRWMPMIFHCPLPQDNWKWHFLCRNILYPCKLWCAQCHLSNLLFEMSKRLYNTLCAYFSPHTANISKASHWIICWNESEFRDVWLNLFFGITPTMLQSLLVPRFPHVSLHALHTLCVGYFDLLFHHLTLYLAGGTLYLLPVQSLLSNSLLFCQTSSFLASFLVSTTKTIADSLCGFQLFA